MSELYCDSKVNIENILKFPSQVQVTMTLSLKSCSIGMVALQSSVSDIVTLQGHAENIKDEAGQKKPVDHKHLIPRTSPQQ